jgi:N utilization substance protein B
MLNRRLIRIKVFKSLFSAVSSEAGSVMGVEKSFLASCDKTKDLYFFMMNVAVALKHAADAKIDAGLKKYHPTPEEKNPNRKFSENLFVERILSEEKFVSYIDREGLRWNTDELLLYVKRLYAAISQKEYFKTYMASPERSLKEDCNLFINIFTEEFEDDENLQQILEDMSLYWMDDLGYVLMTIVSNIEFLRDRDKFAIPETFLKEDDREFAVELMNYSFVNYRKFYDRVAENLSNWDSDRLVSTDIALIVLGIAEAVRFQNIPVKVTINEYVEISKYYSTINSNVFVNGLLDKLIQSMVASGEIIKSGRGLIES